jgi:hypothetical protein
MDLQRNVRALAEDEFGQQEDDEVLYGARAAGWAECGSIRGMI